MAKLWIALYKPHEGKDEALRKLISEHYPTLKRLELITDRPTIVAKSANGTYLEICEWQDEDSANKAHQHPDVARIWEAMGQIADFPGLASLDEAEKQFPHFEPQNL